MPLTVHISAVGPLLAVPPPFSNRGGRQFSTTMSTHTATDTITCTPEQVHRLIDDWTKEYQAFFAKNLKNPCSQNDLGPLFAQNDALRQHARGCTTVAAYLATCPISKPSTGSSACWDRTPTRVHEGKSQRRHSRPAPADSGRASRRSGGDGCRSSPLSAALALSQPVQISLSASAVSECLSCQLSPPRHPRPP